MLVLISLHIVIDVFVLAAQKYKILTFDYIFSPFRQIKVSLLPANVGPSTVYFTTESSDLTQPRFGNMFTVPMTEAVLVTKTLQIHVWCLLDSREEQCLVSLYQNLYQNLLVQEFHLFLKTL